jgi:hypothetical protein
MRPLFAQERMARAAGLFLDAGFEDGGFRMAMGEG